MKKVSKPDLEWVLVVVEPVEVDLSVLGWVEVVVVSLQGLVSAVVEEGVDSIQEIRMICSRE